MLFSRGARHNGLRLWAEAAHPDPTRSSIHSSAVCVSGNPLTFPSFRLKASWTPAQANPLRNLNAKTVRPQSLASCFRVVRVPSFLTRCKELNGWTSKLSRAELLQPPQRTISSNHKYSIRQYEAVFSSSNITVSYGQ